MLYFSNSLSTSFYTLSLHDALPILLESVGTELQDPARLRRELREQTIDVDRSGFARLFELTVGHRTRVVELLIDRITAAVVVLKLEHGRLHRKRLQAVRLVEIFDPTMQAEQCVLHQIVDMGTASCAACEEGLQYRLDVRQHGLHGPAVATPRGINGLYIRRTLHPYSSASEPARAAIPASIAHLSQALALAMPTFSSVSAHQTAPSKNASATRTIDR